MIRHALFGCSMLALAGAAQAQSNATGGTAPPVAEQSVQGTPSPSTQTATDATPVPEAASGDIIVTAQRRSENLQNVPIAITVVGGEALKANNFTNISDTQYLAPSLKFTPTPGTASFSIRGVGSQAFDYSVEQSVGISLDDVIQTLPRGLSLNTLADVERIEVLRGPQGTLFGKNTSAGLISIITRRPKLGEYSTEGQVQYGSRNELQAYNIVNIPLGDTLAARVRASYQLRDPIVRTVSTGSIPKNRDYQFNGKLLWEPTLALSLYAIGDYQNSVGDPGVWTLRTFGAGTVAPGVGNTFVRTSNTALGIVPSPTNRESGNGVRSSINTETYSGQLTANLSLGDHELTSITAYKHLDYAAEAEADSSPLTVLDNNRGAVKAHQFTQELRLASPTGRAFEYVIGGFYYKQKLDSTQRQSGGLGYLPNNSPIQISTVGGLSNFGLRIENYAAFGELTLRPVDRIRVIGGLRYTHDDISSSVFISEIPGVCGFELLIARVCHATVLPTNPIGGSTKKGALTGRGGIEVDLAPRVMAYATVSRGYKGAGIATVNALLSNVRPETVWSEEVGLKSQFFDRKLTLNIAAFHSKYTDFQTQVFDPSVPPAGTFLTGNAGGLRTQGVETEFSVRPLTGLVLSGGISYIDAKFTDYFPACYSGQTAAQGCNLQGPTFDARGTRLPNSPKWSYTLAGSYETPEFNGLKGFVNANYAHRSSVIFGVGNPNTFQPGYGILNMSVGIGDAEGHARFSVFAKNLANKRFAGTIFPTFFDAGGYSQILPDQAYRRIGAALDFRF